jgi:hypothetical protein
VIFRGSHDGHIADRLQDLRKRRNARRPHAIVIADEDAIGRRLTDLLCGDRRQKSGSRQKCEENPGSLHEQRE